LNKTDEESTATKDKYNTSNSHDLNSGRVDNLINKVHSIEKQIAANDKIRTSVSETKQIRIQDIFAPQEQAAANILTEENSFTASARFKESEEKIIDITNTIDINTRSNRVEVNVRPREYAKTYMYKTINAQNSKSI